MRPEFEAPISVDNFPQRDKDEKAAYLLNADTDKISSISSAMEYFDTKEVGIKAIPARSELLLRLTELSQGRKVPVVVFNCLDFTWAEKEQDYPEGIIQKDTTTSICLYRKSVLAELTEKLGNIGNPDINIIIPDSEIFDSRVFNYQQPLQDRIAIARSVKNDLTRYFSDVSAEESVVNFWSEYCWKQDLPSPFDYTLANKERIESNRNLMGSVAKQIKDSMQYFVKNGLNGYYVTSDIPDNEMAERVKWYCAMYAGEGQALADSKAIVVNFEDLRVRKWFQIGADSKLPIVTPAEPSEYYSWRNQQNRNDFRGGEINE